MQDSVWTEERIDDLIRLWIKGRSASEIAAWFAERGVAISRNAIIGKVFRLRKKGDLKAAHRKGMRAPEEPAAEPKPPPPRHDLAAQVKTLGADSLLPDWKRPAPTKPAQNIPAATKSKSVRPTEPINPNPLAIKPSDGRERRVPLPENSPPPDEPATTSEEPATILTLTFNQCRFPITGQPPFHFCKDRQMEGSSYCEAHHRWTHNGIFARRVA